MEDGKISTIIVKDLSRLGRNYIETGRYIELTFPEYDVRFIAINDNYDSLHSENEQQLGIINIFNAMALEQIVLQQIRWVTELAREDPEVFYEKARAKKRDEDEKKLKAVKAEIIKARKRIEELDRIIQKLYEDNVSGRITDERYDKMAQSYETEQSALTKKLAELEEAEASYGEERNSIDDFIANANRFIDIQELTPETYTHSYPRYTFTKRRENGHAPRATISTSYTP